MNGTLADMLGRHAGTAAQTRHERRQHEDAAHIGQQPTFVKCRVDARAVVLAMQPGQFGPMRARVLVMRGMQADIE
ncbi:hypothetical protein D3C87_1497090 [compost metagenome]